MNCMVHIWQRMFRFGYGGKNNEIAVSLAGKSSYFIYLFSAFFIWGGGGFAVV